MRVLILSRRRTLYSTRRLVETARQMGHRALVIDPLNCFIVCGQTAPSIYHKNTHRRLDEVDVVLPRIGASVTEYGLAVVRQFSILGIPIVNNSIPIARSRDKLRSLQLLSQHRIDIPRTVMARAPSQIARALEAVGGPPVILKLIQGSQGVGVMLAETLPQLEAILDTLWGLGQNILIQEFIAESRGRDIRALVVGGRVVGAMRRIARLGEFRSNIHRGGAGRIIELSDEYRQVAVRAAEVMGLQVAGVDMLESRSGPKVIEINSSPGFEGLEQATRQDIAREILDYAVAYAASRGSRGAKAHAAGATATGKATGGKVARAVRRAAPAARPSTAMSVSSASPEEGAGPRKNAIEQAPSAASSMSSSPPGEAASLQKDAIGRKESSAPMSTGSPGGERLSAPESERNRSRGKRRSAQARRVPS